MSTATSNFTFTPEHEATLGPGGKLIALRSRDRINFSRVMLKRFIRDCVVREAAVYSPWTVKPAVAARYGIPTEMSDEVKDQISSYKEKQMDRRKREREERMGITHDGESEGGDKDDSKPSKKKSKKGDAAAKDNKEDVKVEPEEEEKKRRRPTKYPAEGGFPRIALRCSSMGCGWVS